MRPSPRSTPDISTRAHELLREATQAQIAAAQEARKLKEQAQAAEDAQMLGAASSTAAEGDVALTERRYLEAAELFGQAAGYVPSGHASERGGYLLRQADALDRQGDERGDNAALRSSIEVYGRALAEYPRSLAPLDWAATQNDLGNALWTLGERESGTARLEEAVAAYRAALEERTRERVPLDWAATQNNLGNALDALGWRESGTARRRTQHADPHCALLFASPQGLWGLSCRSGFRRWSTTGSHWAATQNNLGGALQALGAAGERDGAARGGGRGLSRGVGGEKAGASSPRLGDDAEQSRHCALKRSARGRAGRRGSRRRSRPIARRWRNGRASGFRSTGRRRRTISAMRFQTLGERESGTARLEEAVAAYRAALEEWTRERVPLDWATTQNNLGNALTRLGERESGTARLEEAVAAYRAALEERTRERVPLEWATTQNNLGNALHSARGAGERDGAARGGGRGLSRGAGGMDARARSARLGDDAEQSRQCALDARRAGERDGAARGGGRGLSRGAGGMDARARSARMGDDAEQSRQCAPTLGERESGTARLEEAVAAYRAALEETDARAGSARLGDDAEQSRQCALQRSGSGRAGRRVSRRRSRPIARRWRKRRASGFRSIGR